MALPLLLAPSLGAFFVRCKGSWGRLRANSFRAPWRSRCPMSSTARQVSACLLQHPFLHQPERDSLSEMKAPRCLLLSTAPLRVALTPLGHTFTVARGSGTMMHSAASLGKALVCGIPRGGRPRSGVGLDQSANCSNSSRPPVI
jgi:hypothetical protein